MFPIENVVPIFHPTPAQMEDFVGYIESMETIHQFHKVGFAKVIPPAPFWTPGTQSFTTDFNYDVVAPLTQKFVNKGDGIFEIVGTRLKKDLTYVEFQRKAAMHQEFSGLVDDDTYWASLNHGTVLYGADVAGSLFPWDWKPWNLSKLDSPLLIAYNHEGFNVSGIQRPSLFFGSPRSTFGWHVEDMDLYAINYHWHGAPKKWNAIPPAYGHRLEEVASKLFWKNEKLVCKAPMRHKTALIRPSILRNRYNIPVIEVITE